MYKRIEICGAIASGKTSLTNAFSKISQDLVFEDFTKIAMLDDFYSDPVSFAFETEFAFTLQHYYQLKKNSVANVVFADFSMIGDYAFALVTLNDDEMRVYKQVFEYIQIQIGKPKKLIRLKASSKTLLRRISRRGRKNEQSITQNYLLQLEDSIDIAINNLYTGVPLIEINTDQYDLADYTLDFLKDMIS